MKDYFKLIFITAVFTVFFFVNSTAVNAEDKIDYINGRPMSQTEIEEQKALEPELNSLIQNERRRIKLENTSGFSLKKALGHANCLDVRDSAYSGNIKVKNQNPTGLCWSFAIITASEIAYMHEQYMNGQELVAVELSPTHFGYFFYNRINDPLENTADDRNRIVNSKYDYRDIGGDNMYSMQAMANWMGLADEDKAPFSSETETLEPGLAYDNDIIIENADFLDNTDDVKTAIEEHGAVAADMYFNSRYMDYNTGAYYDYRGDSYNNHVITIVGWDDNYSRNNFNSSGSSNLRIPESDGAWIVQNSYGESWGDGGYFYISYSDCSLGNAMALDMQPADTYDYNYQYDGNANNMSYITLSSGEKAGNIFTVPEGSIQCLEAIGFTSWNLEQTECRVDIFTGTNKNMNPVSGEKVCSFNVTVEHPGFHTFELPEGDEVMLSGGTSYSIVLTATGDTEMGIESEYKISDVSFECGSEKNQSFIYSDDLNGWYDLYKDNTSVRIKGYTVDKAPDRIYGLDRYETSIKVADTQKKIAGEDKFDMVIVASGNDYPDALTGSYLAKVKSAPVLLVGSDSKSENSLRTYIKTNLGSNGIVYLLGGKSAVSERFEKLIADDGFDVKRLAGSDRYATNIEILREAGTDDEDILVCSGEGYADSLSASAVGKPILLVKNDLLTENQKKYLSTLSTEHMYLVGGTGAVSSKIETELKNSGFVVDRFSGTNRFETSAMVAMEFFSEADIIVCAYGYNFPDGLSGGPLAVKISAPLILVPSDNMNLRYAREYACNSGIQRAIVLGGPGLVPDSVVYGIIN